MAVRTVVNSMRVSIAVDAMGGDHGPSVTVEASVRFLEETADAAIILVGREGDIRKMLDTIRSAALDRISVHAATEVVEMREGPASALRGKKDSSMRVAINLVKDGTAQACVSAGNTGALMAISRFVLKTLPGIDRPAIASQLPTRTGVTTALDLGANVNCTAEQLVQFAVMGSALVATSDEVARQLDLLQEHGNRRDLVGFLLGRDLAQGDPFLTGRACDDVQRREPSRASWDRPQVLPSMATNRSVPMWSVRNPAWRSNPGSTSGTPRAVSQSAVAGCDPRGNAVGE